MSNRNRSPEDILGALEDQDFADDLERVRALSEEDVDLALTQAGFDPGDVRAGAGTAFERAMRKRAMALANGSKTRRRRSQRPIVVWLAAAAMAASVGLVMAMNAATMIAWWNNEPLDRPVASGARTAQDRAERLRDDAVEKCAQGRWAACASKLDEACRIDPVGERAGRVKQMRKTIEAEQGATPSLEGGR